MRLVSGQLHVFKREPLAQVNGVTARSATVRLVYPNPDG